MTTANKDKVREIISLVRETSQITNDTEEKAALQDVLGGATKADVYQVCQSLDREEKRRLLWIVTAISGYEMFEIWAMAGIMEPWAQKRLEELEAAYDDLDREREKALDKEREQLRRERAELETERRRIQRELRAAREHRKNIQERLENEQRENRRIKKLERLLKKERMF